jgi:hypothetical protein
MNVKEINVSAIYTLISFFVPCCLYKTKKIKGIYYFFHGLLICSALKLLACTRNGLFCRLTVCQKLLPSENMLNGAR